MASKFFRGNDSSSESSSSDEENLYETEEDDSLEESSENDDDDNDDDDDMSDDSDDDDDSSGSEEGVNRFLKDNAGRVSSDSSDDEDRVVVLKSQRDKRFEELENTVRALENATKINDWAVIATEFEKLNRSLVNVLKQTEGWIPKIYIKAVADIETAMMETIDRQKVALKKMNAANTRGLNTVRQRIKKIIKDNAHDIELYREDPVAFLHEEAPEDTPSGAKRGTKGGMQRTGGLEFDTDERGFTTVGAGGRAVNYTPESIFKHLSTIVENRGRKNVDRADQVKMLEKLLEIAATDYQRIRVLLTVIGARFDSVISSSYMPIEQWKQTDAEFTQLLSLLEANPHLVVVEEAEEWAELDKHPQLSEDEVFRIPGSVISIAERLADELVRSLQQIDPHTTDYVERLTDEGRLYTNIIRSLTYAERIFENSKVDIPREIVIRMIMRRLEHIYYKPAQVIKMLESSSWKALAEYHSSTLAVAGDKGSDPATLISQLCGYIYAHNDGIFRARAMLYQIHFLALHDEYYRARDMMLMSHLQDSVHTFDVQTQILYNRTLVQVGLCAFRAGLIQEAQTSLQEICGSSRPKELLSQGLQMQRYPQMTSEQEKLERQRQLPFHMHINLELLECVYLTCSMLIEIPLLAQVGSSPDIKKRVVSRTFRRLLEYYERQIFTGPPENTRDHIMKASKALAAGDWKRAADLICAIKIWDLIPQAILIKANLTRQIQLEGLRTFLFTYAPFYDTLSIATLSEMFDMPVKQIVAIVSKMIAHEELRAALDQVNSTVIFRKSVELSRLQTLAITLSDKAAALIESNEKSMEQRSGTRGPGNMTRPGGRMPKVSAARDR